MNLLGMKYSNGRPSRKWKAPAKTVLVRTREPTAEERENGAQLVFVRMDLEGQRYEVLASDTGEGACQFGAPSWVMDENGSDAATWQRERRVVRKRGEYTGCRPPMTRAIRGARA